MLINCYNILSKIFKDGSYSGIVLNETLTELNSKQNKIKSDGFFDTKLITKIVYGVLDKNITLEYYISQLCKKKPDSDLMVILKIGLYQLLYLSIPDYAVVNNTVELTKKTPKRALSGFVNAVLKNYKTVELPKGNGITALSVRFSCPEWLTKTIKDDYPDCFENVLSISEDLTSFTHIRSNKRIVDKKSFEALLDGIDYNPSGVGYYMDSVALNELSKRLTIKDGINLFTVQSHASMLVAELCADITKVKNPLILDACAAPGGKAIYLSELLLDSQLTACDIYPHRVSLLEKYSKSMGANNVRAVLSDGRVLNKDWINKFDLVLCDVPCSGTGAIASKPDIMLNRKQNEIDELNKIQYEIVANCARYVKNGGNLVYSTCSILRAENEIIAERFLKSNPLFEEIPFEFRQVKSLKTKHGRQLLAHISKTEAFYAVAFKKLNF